MMLEKVTMDANYDFIAMANARNLRVFKFQFYFLQSAQSFLAWDIKYVEVEIVLCNLFAFCFCEKQCCDLILTFLYTCT